VQQADHGAGGDRGDDAESDGSAAANRIMQREADQVTDEGRRQHDALDAYIDDARAFVQHAAERAERQRRGQRKDNW